LRSDGDILKKDDRIGSGLERMRKGDVLLSVAVTNVIDWRTTHTQ